MGFLCLGLLLCLFCLHGAAEGRRSNERVLNEMCPTRNLLEVSISGQVCSRGCLRDQDCRKRRCHCDGACGLSCVRRGQTCPWPVSVDNATVRLLGGVRPLFNRWLEVSCLPGFITQAGPTVSRHRCQGDQRWSGSMPECQARQSPKPFCGPPPALPHGGYQVLDHSLGSSIRYKCNPGFVLKGPEVNSCSEDGFWTQQAPTCTAVSCQPPPDIPQSHLVAVQRDSYPAGTKVYYLCHRGYRMVGPHKVTCDLQGEWTQLPTCKASCSISAHWDRLLYQGRKVWHSEIPGGKLHHGETVYFFCEDVDRGCSFLAQAVCTEGQLAIPSCYREPTWVRSTFFPWRLVSNGTSCELAGRRHAEEGTFDEELSQQRDVSLERGQQDYLHGSAQ